jgi:general secretion pathway protein H
VSANPRPFRSRLGEPGFTLIELIVVLAIVSLVLALVVPNIGQRSGKFALAAAAHNVAAALRLTRDQAITQSRPTLFVARGGAYGRDGDKRVWHVPQGVTLAFLDSERSGRAQPSGAIRFYPDGSSTGGTLALTDGATRFTVLVAWINGNVSIQSQPADTAH